MASDVYFVDARARRGLSLLDKVAKLLDAAGIADTVRPGDLTAVKVHVGEPGTHGFVSPLHIRTVVTRVRDIGAKPFLTDSNTLHRRLRSNAADHCRSAAANGFGPEVTGAPFVVADGLTGHDFEEVSVEGRWIRRARIASVIAHADSVVVVTHFTGHEVTGIAGAVKNLGLGLAARPGKQEVHSSKPPGVAVDACKKCGECARWCPEDAMVVSPSGVPSIRPEACTRCYVCTVTCKNGGITTNWTAPDDHGNMQERMAEYALAVSRLKAGRIFHLTFLTNVTADCDCPPFTDLPLVPDIGVLASDDAVAVDQAAADLVNASPWLPGCAVEPPGDGSSNLDKFRLAHPAVEWTVQLAYSEQIGLGSRDYRLVRLSF